MSSVAEDKEFWREAMKAKGHMPRLYEDGDLNTEYGFDGDDHHGGPTCEICNFSFCMWCHSDRETDFIPKCEVIDGEVL